MSEKAMISLQVGFSDSRDRKVADRLGKELRRRLQKDVIVPFLMKHEGEIQSEMISVEVDSDQKLRLTAI